MLEETNINLKYVEAVNFYNIRNLNVAKDLFLELILSDPFRWEFWYSIAAVYQLEKKYKEAILAYKRSCVLNPNDAKVYFHLAECLLSENDTKNALLNLEEANRHCIDTVLKDKISVLYNQNQSD